MSDHIPYLKRAAKALESSAVPHPIVGFMSCNVPGLARSTKDPFA